MKITYKENTVLHQIIPASPTSPSTRMIDGVTYHIVGWAWGSQKFENYWEGFFSPIVYDAESGETFLKIDLEDAGGLT